MSIDRTWRLRIRWGVLFTPACWVRGHRWVDVMAATWFDSSGRLCHRCGYFDRDTSDDWPDVESPR